MSPFFVAGPANSSMSSGTVLDFFTTSNGTSVHIEGWYTLDTMLQMSLMSGMAYVNVHTTAYTGRA